MAVEIKILKRGDESALANVAPGVFDHDVNELLVREFLEDARHHIVVGIENVLPIGCRRAGAGPSASVISRYNF